MGRARVGFSSSGAYMYPNRRGRWSAAAHVRVQAAPKGARSAMGRRARRNSFGTVIATGTTTQPAFAIRWWEGSRRKQKSGYRTRTEAAEALARIRTGLGDGTLVEKRRSAIGFDEVAREWL